MTEKTDELSPSAAAAQENRSHTSRSSLSDAAGAGSGSDTGGANLEKLDSRIAVPAKQDPLEHLSEEEREIIKRQIDVPDVPVKYFDLYKYASKVDIMLVVIAHITSIGAGAVLPLMTILCKYFADLFPTQNNRNK